MRQVFVALMLLAAGTACAEPVRWTLQDVQFDDGATASGFFVLDEATNVFSVIDIDVSGGTFLPDTHYDTAGFAFGGWPILVVSGANDSKLNLVFDAGLRGPTLVSLVDTLLPGGSEYYYPGTLAYESYQYTGVPQSGDPITGGNFNARW